MKKIYLTPAVTVVRLQHQSIICQSTVRGFSSNLLDDDEINYGGGGGGDAYIKGAGSIWDEEW